MAPHTDVLPKLKYFSAVRLENELGIAPDSCVSPLKFILVSSVRLPRESGSVPFTALLALIFMTVRLLRLPKVLGILPPAL
jgi:hypothetical protein